MSYISWFLTFDSSTYGIFKHLKMISLFVENGIAYVWNADDWFTLRMNYRICGSFIGSVPSHPRQNDFLGLPMALQSEEAALLVELNVCELIQLPNLASKPTIEEKLLVKDIEQKVLAEQTEALKKRKVEQLSQKIDIIIAGKKQKLLSKGQTDVQIDKETLLQEEINKLPDLLPAHVLRHLPTEHNIFTEKVKVDTSVLNPSIEKEGAIRFKIFKHFWEKGHHITSGFKFGCDYLLYPGDPVKFHATYMVRCIYNQAASFRPAELVAFGRLSVAVNKLAIFAFCNQFGKIECQTLQWHENLV